MVNPVENESLLDLFLFETAQLIEQLEHIILHSEAEGFIHLESINEIFRIMHTIKGSAGMMMFDKISNLAHSLEDIFFYLRDKKPKQVDYSDLSDLVLEGMDFIKSEVEKINNGLASDGDERKLIDRQKQYLSELKGKIEQIENVTGESTILCDFYKAVVHFSEGSLMENIRAYGIIHNLKKLVEELAYEPVNLTDDENCAEKIIKDGFTIYIKTDLPIHKLQQFFQQVIFLNHFELYKLEEEEWNRFQKRQGDQIENDEKLSLACSKVNDNSNRSNSNRSEKLQDMKVVKLHQDYETVAQQNLISVNVLKLDKLLDLVGEMVITEAMLNNHPDLQNIQKEDLQKTVHQLGKISNEIKDMVMSIRMVPLVTTFHRMNRIVRDMCRQLNKDIQLQVIGEETEVDKNIIDHITDPLMHLVRNAVDHGIESQEERELLGKPKTGSIMIEAKNSGSDIIVTIKDDGSGLNKENILKKARQKNLLPEKAELMTEKEIYQLILLPGFSTKEQVTEFSGRGVGLDVVAKNIEAISGTISIDSNPGKGTSIMMKLPLTLAIIDAMNIQVGNSTYSIPTLSIQEAFRPKENDFIQDPNGNEMIMIRGNCYPVIRLHNKFNVSTEVTHFSDGMILLVQQEGKAVCLFADKLVGGQQIVIKSLPAFLTNYSKIKGIAGCTLLGDGSISLILDISAFVNS